MPLTNTKIFKYIWAFLGEMDGKFLCRLEKATYRGYF
jgi:hypothetical protein